MTDSPQPAPQKATTIGKGTWRCPDCGQIGHSPGEPCFATPKHGWRMLDVGKDTVKDGDEAQYRRGIDSEWPSAWHCAHPMWHDCTTWPGHIRFRRRLPSQPETPSGPPAMFHAYALPPKDEAQGETPITNAEAQFPSSLRECSWMLLSLKTHFTRVTEKARQLRGKYSVQGHYCEFRKLVDSLCDLAPSTTESLRACSKVYQTAELREIDKLRAERDDLQRALAAAEGELVIAKATIADLRSQHES